MCPHTRTATIFSILFLFSSLSCLAQKKEVVFISSIIEEAFFSKSDTIIVKDKIISQSNYINENDNAYWLRFRRQDSLFLFLKSKHKRNGDFIIDEKINLKEKSLLFINCEFENSIYLSKVNLKAIIFENGVSNFFKLYKCQIKSISSRQSNSSNAAIDGNIWTDLSINNSQVESIVINEASHFQISIDSSSLSMFRLWNSGDTRLWIKNSEIKGKSIDFEPSQFLISTSSKTGMLTMDNVNFLPNPIDSLNVPVTIASSFSDVLISKCDFGVGLKFSGSAASRFSIVNSTIKIICFHQFDFPQNNDVRLKWNQLSGFKLTLAQDDLDLYVDNPYNGSNANYANIKSYDDLLYMYKRLLDIYEFRGDQASYNACFAETKDLQTSMARHLFEENKNFNTYFKWKLGQLMKFYTNHGTDPARAIVISIWVILFFGVFYFFFPSDWDVTSKSKLVQNFKDFSEKNEKGYVKPFFILVLGFFVSLINAMTLSLNAFVTLGFGNIPTHGIARYVCVIQGFIGWFLLSVFTVALINQVLG